jgi:hypothetical protein
VNLPNARCNKKDTKFISYRENTKQNNAGKFIKKNVHHEKRLQLATGISVSWRFVMTGSGDVNRTWV